MINRKAAAAALLSCCLPMAAAAAEGAPHIDGAALGMAWAMPFVGMLLSIAVMPLAVPGFWHHHFGKVSLFWALCFLVPCALAFGIATAAYELLHTILGEFVPFVILLTTLFVIAGGIRLRGALPGTPAVNTAMLGVGTVLAGWMGTTGASMLMLRPMIRSNRHRRYNVHVFVFFIFLVANIGGSLTPLGDPPLFLGFLQGIDFFWFLTHLLPETLFCALVLLALFFALDSWLHAREGRAPTPASDERLGIEGGVNFLLLALVVAAVLVNGVWKPGVSVTIYHVTVTLQSLVSQGLLIVLTVASLVLTSKACHEANGFSWAPMAEVAKLFFGIFVTIVPALAILRAGEQGALGWLLRLVTDSAGRPIDWAYFWITGGLSSFLDNAPAWLVLYNVAGGDPKTMMGPLASTLVAISAGAVFMGANTYIGNAPNFMVKAVCEERGIRMPSFFGYMAWSCAILVPLFVLTTLLFLR